MSPEGSSVGEDDRAADEVAGLEPGECRLDLVEGEVLDVDLQPTT
jgi:hypothetical protein